METICEVVDAPGKSWMKMSTAQLHTKTIILHILYISTYIGTYLCRCIKSTDVLPESAHCVYWMLQKFFSVLMHML